MCLNRESWTWLESDLQTVMMNNTTEALCRKIESDSVGKDGIGRYPIDEWASDRQLGWNRGS